MNKRIKKTPWPTKQAMEQVYEMNLWGKGDQEFYSGEGSHNPEIVVPYVKAVRDFLKSFDTPLSIVDLGCGDFNIGNELIPYAKKYIGVDIVESLINRNQEKFKAPNLEFLTIDIADDDLPNGDVAIVRQVLQHLSNDEVQKVVRKLNIYKYIILTEHIPLGDFEPNIDILSGQGIRIKKNSGIKLLESPFNLKVIEEKKMVEIVLNDAKGVIVTTLYTL